MHHLFLLLAIPVVIGVGGWLVSRYHHEGSFNWKELLTQVGVGLALASIGFFSAMCHRTSDTEIWNGRIAKKYKTTGSCCHSYPCNCRQVCSGTGKNRSCSTKCDTCYEHSHDDVWKAVTTNDEVAYENGCNRPGSSAPARWKRIKVDEPTAIEHRYTNYIKGNPDSVIRRQGLKEEYGDLLPGYPEVYDHYRVRRVLGVGVTIPGAAKLDDRLDAINGDLGARKQVNVILLVVRTEDRGYLHALEEHWLGGKKNDAVVIVGTPRFPDIAWAGVMSWSDSEEMKIRIRDGIERLGTFDGDKVLDIVEREIASGFVRKQMSDFAYLKATITPSSAWLWLLYILTFLIAGGLQAYFWVADPFGEDGRFSRAFRFRRGSRFRF